jgi:hypothetical protein
MLVYVHVHAIEGTTRILAKITSIDSQRLSLQNWDSTVLTG